MNIKISRQKQVKKTEKWVEREGMTCTEPQVTLTPRLNCLRITQLNHPIFTNVTTVTLFFLLQDQGIVLSVLENMVHTILVREISIKWFYNFRLFWLVCRRPDQLALLHMQLDRSVFLCISDSLNLWDQIFINSFWQPACLWFWLKRLRFFLGSWSGPCDHGPVCGPVDVSTGQ